MSLKTGVTISGTGAQTALTKQRSENAVTIGINNANTGLTFTVEGTLDGSTWFKIPVIDGGTGLLIAGGTAISPTDSTAYNWLCPTAVNMSGVRINVSAVTSSVGTVSYYGGTQVNGALYNSIAGAAGTFTNGTFSGTLAVTGASTLSGAVTTGSTVSVGGKVFPTADDGAALGDTTHNFSDLFLATGAVINYANSNVVITHTSAVLTMGTGDFRVTTAGTNAASVVTVGGTQTLTNKTLTAPNIGAATGTSLAATGAITSSGATAGIGYATGAGGTVTQLTSRTTGVTINTVSGAITLFSAAGQAAKQAFTVTNSAVAATDTIILNQKSGTDKYDTLCVTAVAAGSFQITFANSSGTTTEQPVFNFTVLKGVAA